jgi:hypothetical protein
MLFWRKFKESKFEESTSWDKFSKLNISENHQVNILDYFHVTHSLWSHYLADVEFELSFVQTSFVHI